MTADTKTYPTRYGPMIGLKGDRFVSRSLEVYGEFCPGEAKLFAQVIRPGMTVVEAGANIGTHSIPLARLCAPGPLYLFEPQQRVFQLLCANLANNGVTNAIAYPEACGAETGFALIPNLNYGAQDNFGGVSVRPIDGASEGARVRVTPLDSLGLKTCHLLKVDVEGFEPQLLAGATGTIARCRPLIYIENDRPAHQQEVINQISALGYRLYWHTPTLFSPDNFNGATEDVFGGIGSLNMFCIPAEITARLPESAPIDPANWTAPGAPADRSPAA